MAKEIILTQSKVAVVDNIDFEWLNQWKWYAAHRKTKSGDLWYAVREIHPDTCVLMHRIIAKRACLPPAEHYDHKDHDGLNNRRSNLRPATRTQNLGNQRKTANRSSSFKGVSWDESRNRWRAQICIENRRRFLGRFSKEEDAADAYAIAAHELFGEFTNTTLDRPFKEKA